MNFPQLEKILQESKRVVFFGGAGVATESGIPDFRSTDGLYNQTYAYPPETILSHTFFVNRPEEFFSFYRDKLLYLDAKPNPAHYRLAEWEKEGLLKAIVTQNIDGLHQAAGSNEVLELHGSVHRNYCQKCGAFFDAQYIKDHPPIPHCPCGGVIKPDVVLYEEPLNDEVVDKSVLAISQADTVIVGGTSLSVYPAAGLLHYFNGRHLVLINKTATPYDSQADLLIQEPIGQVFASLNLSF